MEREVGLMLRCIVRMNAVSLHSIKALGFTVDASKIKSQRDEKLVSINKAEKKQLQEKFPTYKFPRTMRQDSKRGHYFCVESPPLLDELERIRNKNVIVRCIKDTTTARGVIVVTMNRTQRGGE